MMSYHEMTVNQPGDSSARRQQFLVTCSIMVFAIIYHVLWSGLIDTIEATTGPFPGGNFCYKFAIRDYAASIQHGHRIAKQWALATLDSEEKENPKKLQGEEKDEYNKLNKNALDTIYNVYLDDPRRMGGTRQRFMTGMLVSDADKAEFCDPLMEKNEKIERLAVENMHIPLEDKSAAEVFAETLYQYVDLPSVDSLVVEFPCTYGFVSSLIFSYKVCSCANHTCETRSPLHNKSLTLTYAISLTYVREQVLPKMRKMVVEMGGGADIVPLVISHCNRRKQWCTHYAPLVQTKDFLIGQPTTDEYLAALGPESFLDWEHLKGGVRKFTPNFLKGFIDMLP
jgi:hypothetical protein